MVEPRQFGHLILMSIRACVFFSRTFCTDEKNDNEIRKQYPFQRKKSNMTRITLTKIFDLSKKKEKRIFNTPIFFCYCDPLLKACYGC